jgi:hypothetical protein
MAGVRRVQDLQGMHRHLSAFRCGSPRIGILSPICLASAVKGYFLPAISGISSHSDRGLLFPKSSDIELIRIAVSLPIFDTLKP